MEASAECVRNNNRTFYKLTQMNYKMNTTDLRILTRSFLLSLPFVIGISCSSKTETTTTTTTINGDTSKEDEIVEVTKDVTGLTKELIEEHKEKKEEEKAARGHYWVYQIGDAYNSEDAAAQAYDAYAGEGDVYLFRNHRKEYYLIKGKGQPAREMLDDSLNSIKRRISDVRPADLSERCDGIIKNTSAVSYKIDKQKKHAVCKGCE